MRHSRICARDRSWLNANYHNWWTTMPVKRHQKYGAKKKKKKEKTLLRASLSDIHNPVKLFWVLRLITCFNVGNNFTTTNTSNILSEFPCSLTKVSHGFNTKKINKKIHDSYSHGNRIYINHGFVTSNNNIQRSIKIIFFVVIKTKPTTAFKMT